MLLSNDGTWPWNEDNGAGGGGDGGTEAVEDIPPTLALLCDTSGACLSVCTASRSSCADEEPDIGREEDASIAEFDMGSKLRIGGSFTEAPSPE